MELSVHRTELFEIRISRHLIHNQPAVSTVFTEFINYAASGFQWGERFLRFWVRAISLWMSWTKRGTHLTASRKMGNNLLANRRKLIATNRFRSIMRPHRNAFGRISSFRCAFTASTVTTDRAENSRYSITIMNLETKLALCKLMNYTFGPWCSWQHVHK